MIPRHIKATEMRLKFPTEFPGFHTGRKPLRDANKLKTAQIRFSNFEKQKSPEGDVFCKSK